MTPVGEILAARIRREGVVSFEDFMRTALYCPELGYYERFPHNVGRRGDYFTSVSVGPLFGELLWAKIGSWLRELGDGPLYVVEAGAHDGLLARDILRAAARPGALATPAFEYCILEPSARQQSRQARTLSCCPESVRWVSDWSELGEGGIRGVILSNELLDAMPVRRLGWNRAGRKWFEWGVGFDRGAFIWERLPPPFKLPEPLVPAVPPELSKVLPEGFSLEVSPASVQWWESAAQVLREGWLLTFDYGLEADEWFSPFRASGTLRGYANHKLVEDPLAQPGLQDLTAHVNWTQVMGAGEAQGLQTDQFMSQGRFLSLLARSATETQTEAFPSVLSPRQRREFNTLTHPGHLGMSFEVLVQRRRLASSNPPIHPVDKS